MNKGWGFCIWLCLRLFVGCWARGTFSLRLCRLGGGTVSLYLPHGYEGVEAKHFTLTLDFFTLTSLGPLATERAQPPVHPTCSELGRHFPQEALGNCLAHWSCRAVRSLSKPSLRQLFPPTAPCLSHHPALTEALSLCLGSS